MPRFISSSVNSDIVVTQTSTGNTLFTFSGINRSASLLRSDVVNNPITSDGWRNPSPYNVDSVSAHGPTGKWINKYYNQTYSGPLRALMYDDWYETVPASNAGLRSKAEVGALLKLKDQQVNLAQAFAERSQVADMFVTTIGRVARGYRALKRGNIKAAARELGIVAPRRMPRELASRWLELQYGWKPLLSDIHGTVMEFASRDRLNRYRVSVRKLEKQIEQEFYVTPPTGGAYCPVGRLITRDLRYKCRLDYIPDNFELIELASLGLYNPALLAWELVPFSFVADWVVPIGDWISSLDAAAGYQFIGGSMTERAVVHAKYQEAATDAGKSISADVSGRLLKKKIRRTVYESSPIPSLPGIKNPWSYVHAANAAALLVTVTSGAKPPRNR